MGLLSLTTASSLGSQNKGVFPCVLCLLASCKPLVFRGFAKRETHGPLTAMPLHSWEGRCHQFVLSRADTVPIYYP